MARSAEGEAREVRKALQRRLRQLVAQAAGQRVHIGKTLGQLYQENEAFRSAVQEAGGAKGLCDGLDGIGVEKIDGGDWFVLQTPALGAPSSPSSSDSAGSNSAARAGPAAARFSTHGREAREALQRSVREAHRREVTLGVPHAQANVGGAPGAPSSSDGGGGGGSAVPKATMSRDLLALVRESKRVQILEVGAGDGSHPLSYVDDLPEPRQQLVVAFYGSREEEEGKYREDSCGPSAAENFRALEERGVRLAFGVDATRLDPGLGRFNVVIFRFPHTGVPNIHPDNVPSNRALLSGFYEGVRGVAADPCEVQVTLKGGFPYEQWDVEQLIADAGMVKTDEFEFKRDDFEGYVHRTTLGNAGQVQEVQDKNARVYLCQPGEVSDREVAMRRAFDPKISLRAVLSAAVRSGERSRRSCVAHRLKRRNGKREA